MSCRWCCMTTTLYLEAEWDEDALRKVGYPSERRVDPQVLVGPGGPNGSLQVGCFEGNAEKGHDHPGSSPGVCRPAQHRAWHGRGRRRGDAVLCNLRELDEAKLRFIVGSRVTKAPIDLARTSAGTETRSPTVRSSTPHPPGSQHRQRSPTQKAEPVWAPRRARRVVAGRWAYSVKRAARDSKTDPAGEPGQGGRRRREGRPHPGSSRQQRRPAPWMRCHWPGCLARGPEGLRHQHPHRADACGWRSSARTTTSGRSRRRSGCPRATYVPGRSSTTPRTRSRPT